MCVCWCVTYLLTQWCRFLLEKLTGLQLVKKFPAFHGTRRFITALTSFRHLSLSWASPIQSIYPHPTSWMTCYLNKLQNARCNDKDDTEVVFFLKTSSLPLTNISQMFHIFSFTIDTMYNFRQITASLNNT